MDDYTPLSDTTLNIGMVLNKSYKTVLKKPHLDSSTRYVKIKPMKLFMPNTRLITGALEIEGVSPRKQEAWQNTTNPTHRKTDTIIDDCIVGSAILTKS